MDIIETFENFIQDYIPGADLRRDPKYPLFLPGPECSDSMGRFPGDGI